MKTDKSILLLVNTTGATEQSGRDAVDLALAALAFDQQISVIFIGDGLAQIETAATHTKTPVKAWRSVVMHGVQRIGICELSMSANNLASSAFVLEGQFLQATQIAQWIAESDVVLSA